MIVETIQTKEDVVNVYATQQMILPVATVDAFQQTGFVTTLMTAKMGAMKLPIVDLNVNLSRRRVVPQTSPAVMGTVLMRD